MALKSELMALGMNAGLAKRIGFDPPTAFTANLTVQATATTLTANHANVTTSGGNTAVVMADAEQMYFITTTGGQTMLVFPPSGGTFSGKTLNASISVPDGKSVWIEPAGPSGITWAVSA